MHKSKKKKKLHRGFLFRFSFPCGILPLPTDYEAPKSVHPPFLQWECLLNMVLRATGDKWSVNHNTKEAFKKICENCSETSPWNWKIILLTSIKKISNSKAQTSLAKFKVEQEITKYLKYLIFKISRFRPTLLGHCCAGCHAGLGAGTGSSLYNFTPWHIKLLCLWLSGWFVPSVSRNME